MESVFVAQWFDDRDRVLVSEVERLLFSHELISRSGHHTDGDSLEQTIKDRIDRCDAVIALATRRDKLADRDEWTTHPWVTNEYGYGKALGSKPVIAVVEDGVNWAGMYGGHRYIPLDRDEPSRALLDLSNTVGEWKMEAGESWTIQLRPDEVTRNFDLHDPAFECDYRTYERASPSDWRRAMPVREPGGVFLYLNGLQAGEKIEVRMRNDATSLISDATAKWMPVDLREV